MRDHNTTQRKAWLSAMQHGTPDKATIFRDSIAALLAALLLLALMFLEV
jgi:hypothetical protein